MVLVYLHDGVRVEAASSGQPADFLDHLQRRAAPHHQHPGFCRPWVGKAVHYASRHEHKPPRTQPLALAVKKKLHHALDDDQASS